MIKRPSVVYAKKKGGKHQRFCCKHVSQLPAPPVKSGILGYQSLWPSFKPKIPFLLTIFTRQKEFLFPYSNFIRKKHQGSQAQPWENLTQASLAHLFLPLCQMQQFDCDHVTLRPPTADGDGAPGRLADRSGGGSSVDRSLGKAVKDARKPGRMDTCWKSDCKRTSLT